MKIVIIKSVLLLLYLATVQQAWSYRDSLDGLLAPLVVFFLAYCSTIVASQLASSLTEFWCWLGTESRAQQTGELLDTEISFDTESEAV